MTDLAIPSSLFSPKTISGSHGVEAEDKGSPADQDLVSTFPLLLKDLDQVTLPSQEGPGEAGSDRSTGNATAFLREEGPILKGDFHLGQFLMENSIKEGPVQLLKGDQLRETQGSPAGGGQSSSSSFLSFQDGQPLEAKGPKKAALLKRGILAFRTLEGDQPSGILRPGKEVRSLSLEGKQFLNSQEAKVESKRGGILNILKKQAQVGPQGPSGQWSEGPSFPLKNKTRQEFRAPMGILEFQNHFEDRPLFKPMAQRSETVLQDLSPQVAHSSEASMTAREFLGNLQSQTLNTIEQGVSSAQLFAIDSSLRTGDTQKLIERISHYIIQNSVGNTKEVDLSVKHPEIGNFRVNVSQDLGQPGVQLLITAFNKEGADFFALNQVKLLSNLEQNGVKVQDFKLEQQFSGGQYSSSHEGDREAYSQERQDAKRRRQLWEQLSEGMT